MKNTGFAFGSLLSGLLIGSVVTMFVTPKSGAEMRRKFKKFVNSGVDKVKETVENVGDKVEETMDGVDCQCND